MAMAVDADDALWLVAVTAVVFLSYLPHLFYSIQRWHQERSFRSTRGLFVALMLQLGMLRILIGVTDRAVPGQGAVGLLNTITAPVLTAFLLSGGVFLTATWIIERRRRVRSP
jgi:hypothetical protein